MAALRIVAWVLVAMALMLIGADAMSTFEQGEPVVRTTAEMLSMMGLDIARPEGGIAGVVNFLLDAPLWAVIGVVGVILTLLFRPID